MTYLFSITVLFSEYEEEQIVHFEFLEKPNCKEDRAQSFSEDAKGDGEPSNAFLSEPI